MCFFHLSLLQQKHIYFHSTTLVLYFGVCLVDELSFTHVHLHVFVICFSVLILSSPSEVQKSVSFRNRIYYILMYLLIQLDCNSKMSGYELYFFNLHISL